MGGDINEGADKGTDGSGESILLLIILKLTFVVVAVAVFGVGMMDGCQWTCQSGTCRWS